MRILLLCFSLFLAITLRAQLSPDDMIDQVYTPSFFDNNADLRPAFLHLLSERIHYVNAPQEANEKYPLLSSCTLNNKDFPNLTVDTDYNAATFNPLKYNMDFFSKTTKVYRFDGSDYLIVIDPQ